MQDSKRWELWERLAPVVLEREEGFGNITVGGATDQQGKDNLLDFIASEISKAREEVLYEIKDEIFFGEIAENLGEKISKERIKNIIDDKLSKLTTK